MWLRGVVSAAMVVAALAEEEKKEVSQTSMAVCLMLMGTVGSTMGAFYLVNHHDKDIKTSTWKVICNTISIFAAVLLFQAVNGLVTYIFLDGATLFMKVVVSFLHSAAWFAVLQIFLALVSRSIPAPKFLLKPMPEEEGEEREEVMECIRLDMKCWGILFGHIAGFASINAWCVVQQVFNESLIGSGLVIAGAAISLWLTFLITDMCREHIAMADDGEKDACEELWDESVEETEEDVRALTLSFLTVQWIRFAIFGALPSPEGDLPDRQFTGGQILTLLGLAVFIVIYNNMPGRMCCKERLLGKSMIVRNILNLVFAWSIMYTFRTWLLTEKYLHSDASGEVLQATVLTWATFAAEHLLDYLADLEATGKETDAAIRSLMNTLSVLVGFSWEKCFDVAVDNIAEKVEAVIPEDVTKLALAMVLASSVLPAWRWYILPVLDRLGGFEEEEEEEEEEESKEREEDGEIEAPKEGYRPLPDGAKEAFDRPAFAGAYGVAAGGLTQLAPRPAQPVHVEPAASDPAMEAELLALRRQMQATSAEVENLQQKLRGTMQVNEQQNARLSAALKAEQDQRTRTFQLETEKSQLEAELGEVRSQLEAVVRSQAHDGQLATRLGELQENHDVATRAQAALQAENGQLSMRVKDLTSQLQIARQTQAAEAENSHLSMQVKDLSSQLQLARNYQAEYQAANNQLSEQVKDLHGQLAAAKNSHAVFQAEKGQFEERIADMTSQLEGARRAKEDGSAIIENARIRELEEQLQAAERQKLIDKEEILNLQAALQKGEDPRQKNIDPTANDELNKTIIGPPVGSSCDVAPAVPIQTGPPHDPLSASLNLSVSQLENPINPPQLRQRELVVPSVNLQDGPSARAKGHPVSPPGGRAPLSPGAKAAPVSLPAGTSARTAAPPSGKAPSRKLPASQPGQVPAAPRLSTALSEPQVQRNGANLAVRQGYMGPATVSRGASSKEAVIQVAAVQPQPPRRGGGL